ncbi:MAG TPA: multidrug efflux SMR transporter [Hyphomicrobiaceae bacterium]|nr:multidrug efflux SMR transporter [Hyphomicrobiaceae bacterium]
MSWVFLGAAGLLEVLFTTLIRYTDGFTRLWPTFATLAIAALSFYCLARSTEAIPLGTAYAIWGAAGAAGTVIIGILYFSEPLTAWRLFFISTLIGSIMGLKLVSDH